MHQHEIILTDINQATVALRNKVIRKLTLVLEQFSSHEIVNDGQNNSREDHERNELILNKASVQCEQFVMSKQKVLLMASDNQVARGYLFQSLLQQLHKRNIVIPVYIELDKVNNLLLPFLQPYIQKEYNSTPTLVNEILNSDNTLLIFDHYGLNNQLANLQVTQELNDRHAKTIVIANYYSLRRYANYLPCFVPYKRQKKQVELFSEIHVLLSGPFTNIPFYEEKQQSSYTFITKAENLAIKSLEPVQPKGITRLDELLLHPMNHNLVTHDVNMMRLLADIIKQDNKYKDFLFEIIYQSRDDKKLNKAAANAITALNYAKISFAGMDLSGIKIPGADLSGAILDHTDLSNGDLSNVNFSKSFLNQTLFDGSNLDNAVFGEHPYFEQENSVELLKVNHSGTQLISTDSNKIYTWDLQKKQSETIFSYNYKIEHICVMPNDKEMVLIDVRGNVLLYDLENKIVKNSTKLEKRCTIKFIQAINDKSVVLLILSGFDVQCLELDISNMMLKIFAEFNVEGVTAVAIDHNRKYIAYGILGHYLKIGLIKYNEQIAIFSEPQRQLTKYELSNQRFLFDRTNRYYFYDLKFSHNDQWLLSIGKYRNLVESHSDKLTADKIKLCHINSKKEYLLWCENYREVNVKFISTCFSLNDENVIAMISGEHGYIVKIWQTNTADLIYEYDNYTTDITAMAFINITNTWDVIYGNNKGKITQININNKEKTLSSTTGHYVGVAGLKIKSPYAISWSDHNIRIWLAENGRLVDLIRARQHNDFIPKFVFCSTDNLIISLSKNGDIKIWLFPSKQIYQAKLQIDVRYCKFATSKNILVIFGSSKLYIYKITPAGEMLIYEEGIDKDKDYISGLKFSSDNAYLAVSRRHMLEIFIVKNDSISKCLTVSDDSYTPHIYFDPKSEWLAWQSDREIFLYHLFTQKLIRKIPCSGYRVKSIQITSDNKIVALLNSHGHRTKLELLHVDVTEPQLIIKGDYYDEYHLNKNNNKLAITRYNDLIIIDLATKKSQVIAGHSDKISTFKFLNNDMLLTASADSSIKAWKRMNRSGDDCYYLLWTSHNRFFSRDCSYSNAKNLSSANEKALRKDNVKYDTPTSDISSDFRPILG